MVKIFENILPPKINLEILKLLVKEHWHISWDGFEDQRLENIFKNNNNGFNIVTFKKEAPDYTETKTNPFLNLYAEVIGEIVMHKLNIKNFKFERFFWNMYFKNSTSDIHKDRQTPGYLSILYSIHTTDGGTEIAGKKYEDKMGIAKVFDSHIDHRGLSPIKDPVRFNLNIIAEIV
tara:strand:- start:238 stop:765 length:528 start_codon:yes stop_codon:yes gene_type:complete